MSTSADYKRGYRAGRRFAQAERRALESEIEALRCLVPMDARRERIFRAALPFFMERDGAEEGIYSSMLCADKAIEALEALDA